MLLVLMDTLSIVKERMLTLFGYLNAPHDHAEISFSDVVPGDGLMLGGRSPARDCESPARARPHP
jgi:acyl-CoA dehydrogenase